MIGYSQHGSETHSPVVCVSVIIALVESGTEGVTTLEAHILERLACGAKLITDRESLRDQIHWNGETLPEA